MCVNQQETLSPDPCILTQELTRCFDELTAVDGLNLVVPRGTFFGFLGPNGAGKSTTLAMLTGLLAPTSGSATILGFDLDRDMLAIKQRIGVVPEKLALFERLTGREYLLLAGRLYGVPRNDLLKRTEELLEFMDLSDAAHRMIVEYSHGMKKKLALSAALIHRPQALFLDEPFEGIDALSTRSIREVLQDLVKTGLTIFLTSHVLEIVERLCDRVAIIHQGKLVATGSLAELQAGIEMKTGMEKTERLTLEEIFVHLLGQDSREKRSLSWLMENDSQKGIA